ncbi:hypothetical protein GLOTRDRAFT_132957 [Gloeophyllum trabeum ATCC 11539]|uniref:Uncharacterized protein n=1 Tax=Gloeophyllum trabeum (strain ATCC 11539 / FP-39264 / Madison 617) TaxID=670483 RepID=S7PVZ8_GLOTA|nr:uncharacterized protein GLOTRDRAFT_132957 [Gloeophyllum trabeum ATCC 11539]EPQ51693.1 hypothetical protein GLOTRDRAFT_132957 [Gloeophyllum trabeum ATCC 11539]
MNPIVFGLDLRNIRPSAFKSKNMWNKAYHLRSERFILYQLAMVITVVAECLATYALDKYLHLQDHSQKRYPGVYVYNNDIVGATGLTIFAGVFNACVFGSIFFFLLFWPESRETPFWAAAKQVGAVVAMLSVLAASITSTVIGATHSATISGVDEATRQAITAEAEVPLKYSHYRYIIVYIVLLWIGWVFTLASTVMVFIASNYYLHHQPAPHPTRQGTADSEKALRNDGAAQA